MKTAAILVSLKNEFYTNPILFSRILAKAGSEADEVYLIIGCSLRRWNLLAVNMDMSMEQALKHAILDGDVWCNKFFGMAQMYLDKKFKGYIRWEDIRSINKSVKYDEMRAIFGRNCDKQKVLVILEEIIVSCEITKPDDFVKNTPLLNRKKGELLPNSSSEQAWKDHSWENIMAASILEYTLRYFNTANKKEFANTESHDGNSFLNFLLQNFLPNSYEHQAEEAVLIYKCLIQAGIKLDNLYYPNIMPPILKKSYIEYARQQHLMRWENIKINADKQILLEEKIHIYFSQISNLSKSEQSMLAQSIQPLMAVITTVKPPEKRAALVFGLIGFLSMAPQTILRDDLVSNSSNDLAYSSILSKNIWSVSQDNQASIAKKPVCSETEDMQEGAFSAGV